MFKYPATVIKTNLAWKFLEDHSFDHLRIGDIWLTSSKDSQFGKLIRRVTSWHGDPVTYNHIAGYTGSGNILEALHMVTERLGKPYFRSSNKLKIIRNRAWNQRQRAAILFQAKKYTGMPYGYLKVFLLQGLDCVFRTDKFTRCFSITPLPYCSQLWAQAVAMAGIAGKINGKHPKSVNPDDWDDEAERNEDWQTVLEHDGKNCRIEGQTVSTLEKFLANYNYLNDSND